MKLITPQGYKSSLDTWQTERAIKYFKDYLKYDKGNYAVYLYLSNSSFTACNQFFTQLDRTGFSVAPTK